MKADTAAGLALTALGLAMAAGATEPSVALVAMPAVTLPVIWRRSAPFAAAVCPLGGGRGDLRRRPLRRGDPVRAAGALRARRARRPPAHARRPRARPRRDGLPQR